MQVRSLELDSTDPPANDYRLLAVAGALQRRIYDLLSTATLSGEQRSRLGQLARAVEEVESRFDSSATQFPDDVLPATAESEDEEEEDDVLAPGDTQILEDEDNEFDDLGPESQLPESQLPESQYDDGFEDREKEDEMEVEPSQMAVVLEEEKVVEGDEEAGLGTQIDDFELDDSQRNAARVEDLKAETVAFLRSVGDAVPTPAGTRSAAAALIRKWRPFETAFYDLARRAVEFLKAVSARAEATPASTPVLPAPPPDVPVDVPTQPEGMRAPEDAPELAVEVTPPVAPTEDVSTAPRIVARATDVFRGGVRHSFLLYEPMPRTFDWLTEAGMRADPLLRPILEAFNGPRDDPNGNGFVSRILDMRGPERRRQYLVRWTVLSNDPPVPRDKAEEWMPVRSLVGGAQALARAYEQSLENAEDDSDDEDDDTTATTAPSQSSQQPQPETPAMETQDDDDAAAAAAAAATIPSKSAIRWDPISARPKVSLRAAIRYFINEIDADAVQILHEYTLNRRWALQSRLPPPAVSDAELDQAATDLFEIDEKALTGTFKRERLQAQRERLAVGDAGDEGDDDEEELDEDTAFEAWKAERISEFRVDMQQRWAASQREYAVDFATLDAQEAALDVMERSIEARETADPISELEAARTAGASPQTLEILDAWASGNVAEAARLFSRPRLKVAQIRDFLSANRSATTRGFLALLRRVHGEATAEQRRSGVLGSAYSASWPSRESPTELPPDHVCAVEWMEKGTKLLVECAAPDQLPFQCVISRLSENSSKGSDVLSVFSPQSEASGKGLYNPRISTAKKARLAKLVVSTFLLLPLLSNKKTSGGAAPYERASGVEVFARAWRFGPFRQLLERPATPFERRVALLTLAMPKWQICCPFAFGATLTVGMERMLTDRFRGTDGISRLVDRALARSIEAAP
jgi:hypothetical protein